MPTLITTGEAARILEVSRERVLAYIRDGRLHMVAQDSFGRRLLHRTDVEQFAAERRKYQKADHGRMGSLR